VALQVTGEAPRGLLAWWVFRKWAWRNTAAGFWLILLFALGAAAYSLLSGHPFTFPAWVTLHWPKLVAGVGIWILLICELQLTQLLGFVIYVISLPIWLPVLTATAYFKRRKARSEPIKTELKVSTSLRLWHVAGLVLLMAVLLWWPLPSRLWAALFGTVALIPLFLLLKRAYLTALSPVDWVIGLRGRAADIYRQLKASIEKTEAQAQQAAMLASIFNLPTRALDFLLKPGRHRLVLRSTALLYFYSLILVLLVYVGFVSALWLRAATPEAELLKALGRPELPNLLYMSFMCVLAIVGEWTLDVAVVGAAAKGVVLVTRLVGGIATISLITTFHSNYSADAHRFDQASLPEG
jgi:hypothetical protein